MNRHLFNFLCAMLRPAVRFCLRRSFHVQDLLEAAKQVFVEEAARSLAGVGEKETVSRLAVMTGLQRRDVMRLQTTTDEGSYVHSLLARVMGQWQFDRKFTTRRGEPRVLSIKEGKGSFYELVGSVSLDLNPATVLKELNRLGFVEKRADKVTLKISEYIPKNDPQEGFRLLSEDAGDLAAAVEENIFRVQKFKHLHAKTEFDNVPADKLAEINLWFLAEGKKMHDKARKFLSRFDRDLNPTLSKANPLSGETIRVALGTFSYIAANEAKNQQSNLD